MTRNIWIYRAIEGVFCVNDVNENVCCMDNLKAVGTERPGGHCSYADLLYMTLTVLHSLAYSLNACLEHFPCL